jgi:hypothetical protein
MPQASKSADKQKRTAEKGKEPKSAGHPEAGARAWASASKLRGAGQKFPVGRKVPSGPVGGLGRKTNLTRSS